ncbi:MAG: methyl-accepting chemotaxis protein, partial [Spirochaetaceae bacterium]|nr:methyl-accepting chemotaxis protein [Spirochaetaceae bacterium]
MNLAKRVSLLIGILVLAVSLSMGLIALFVASGIVETTAETTLINQAELGADVIQNTVHNQMNILQELANRSRVQSMVWANQVEGLKNDIARTGFLEMGVVTPGGNVHYILDDSTGNLADRDYVQEALAGRQAVSDVIISRLTNKPVIMDAGPIPQGNRVAAALIARKDVSTFSDITATVKMGTTGYSYIVNSSGVIIAHPDGDLVQRQFNPMEESKADPSLESLAGDLFSTMDATTAAINQIVSNITGVKEKTITQAASVTETSATMEETKGHTERLNNSIESQSAAVVESSSAIEEMVANIKSVADILNKNSESMEEL